MRRLILRLLGFKKCQLCGNYFSTLTKRKVRASDTTEITSCLTCFKQIEATILKRKKVTLYTNKYLFEVFAKNGHASVVLAGNRDEVLSRLKIDPYTNGIDWNKEKIQITLLGYCTPVRTPRVIATQLNRYRNEN
jgi:hypothetical protein